MSITFGTEGWRAIIGEEFTADNVRSVTQAIAEHVGAHAPAGLRSSLTMVIGYDTRFLSDYFAQAICEVLAGNGIRSVLTDRAVPTCAVSRSVVARRLPAGIMVTASHNPAIYNGMKVKESYGGSATPQTVASIERRLGRSQAKRLPLDEARRARLVRVTHLLPEFLRGIRSSVDIPTIRRSTCRVVVDSMHGTGGRLIEGLLAGGSCRVETIHAEPDPLFGGHAPEPIASHLRALSATVLRRRASLGIANDGDADRIGVIGPDGVWLSPGHIMCVLLQHLVTTRRAHGAVVKTVSNTMMIDRMTKALGLRLLEVPVGFKHIAKLMLDDDVLIGGEESGGIGVTSYLPERDGIFNGLLLLEAMATRGQGVGAIMRELERRYGRWYYSRHDLTLKPAQVHALFKRLHAQTPDRLIGAPVAKVSTLDGIKLIGRDDSWLLFRRSGTEPIVRIYAETPRRSHLNRLIAFGVRLAHTA